MIDLTTYRLFFIRRARICADSLQFVDLCTDVTYIHLFGMTANELRVYFHLPVLADDECIRDCMGTDALVALDAIESRILKEKKPESSLVLAMLTIWRIAEEESKRIKANNPNFSATSGGLNPLNQYPN